jgi:hypothetical protein
MCFEKFAYVSTLGVKFFISCLGLFYLCACDLKINDRPPKQEDLIFEDENNVKCISKTVPYFEAFLKGEPEGVKVKEFWICSALAMSSFKTKTKGSDDGQYSAKAMAVFFEKYFLDNMVITDTLIEEAMRLKQVLLGGSIKNFTNEELDQFVVIFTKMGDLSQELFPYMNLYSGKWKPKAETWDESDVQYFEKGSAALDKLVNQLIDWTRLDSANYPIDHFLIFLREFDKMMKHSVDFASPIEKLFPILKKLKVILASGDADFITAHEWKNFLTLGAKGYMIYLRWDLFLNQSKGGFTQQIWTISRIFDDSILLITELIKNKGNTRITSEDFYEILMKFHDLYPEFVVSKKLVAQLMLIKKAILGSSSEYWEQRDFERAKVKVELLKDLALKLLPYLDLFLNKWVADANNSEVSQKFLQQAFESLRLEKENFVALWDQAYDWSNVSELFNELTILYPQNIEIKNLLAQGQVYLPVFISIKQILIADDSYLIGPEQWKNLLSPILNLFEIYETQRYFPSKDEFLSEAGLEYWNNIIKSIFVEFESSVRLRPDGKILVAEIENLIKVLNEAKLIDIPRVDSLNLLRHLMQIKKSMLNSSSDFWLFDDFVKANKKLGEIKHIAVTLLPYFDVYFDHFQFNKAETSAARKFVGEAFQALKNSYPNYINLWESSFDMSLFRAILADLEKIITDKKSLGNLSELSNGWDKYFPVILSIKKLLINDGSSVVDPVSLKSFLSSAINLFEIYTKQKYFPNNQKTFLTKSSIEYWSGLVLSVFAELETTLKSRPNAQIKVADVDGFLKVLDGVGLTTASLNVSRSLLNHLMEIKKSVLGTSSDYWTTQDLTQIRPKLNFAKSLLIELLPYLDVIKGKWQPNIQNREQSKKHLSSFFQILFVHKSEFIGLWRKPFDWTLVPFIFDDLVRIFPETQELVDLGSRWNIYFPIVVAAKQIITGKNSTSLDSKDWGSFYQPAFDIYELYLNYRYFVSKEKFEEKSGFESWYSLINSLFYILDPISKTREQIPLADIDNLIAVLEQSNLVKLDFDRRMINKFGPLLLTKYLIDPKYRPQRGNFTGLTRKHIEYLSIKWISWADAQRFLFALIEDKNVKQLKLADLHKKVSELVGQHKDNKTFTLSLMQMSNILLSPQNLVLNDDLILPIAIPDKNIFLINSSSLIKLNLVRSVVDLAFAGYLPKGKSFMSGIEESEFKSFINDLVPLLKEVGWLQRAKENFAESRFLEGNLFTPSADGDEVLSFQEGCELVTMIISGVMRSKDLIKTTRQSCHGHEIDFADMNCFRGEFYENRDSVFTKMPSWLVFLNQLSRVDMSSFTSYLEQGAEVEMLNGEIYIPDLMLLTNLSQYIEVIFTRVDTNGDGILETDEAMRVYPVFKMLLTKLSKLKDPSQVRALFAFILKYGKAPEQNAAGYIEFDLWANNPSAWELNVDRMQMAKIFNFIQSEKSKQNSN